MKILLTGATGLIGKELGKKLVELGHELHVLSTNPRRAKLELPFPAQVYLLDNHHFSLPQELIEQIDAVINLAGDSIGEGRWSEKKKKILYDSRILTTKNLVNSFNSYPNKEALKLKTFISASAIGIYGNRGQEVLSEDTSLSEDFLSKICTDWEKESAKLSIPAARVVNPRIGIVLSPRGGALQKMLLPFSLGFGGSLGSGKQWMSWIHLKDIVSSFVHILDRSELMGPLNLCSPHPVTNKEFSRILAQALQRPLFLPAPGFVLKILLGEMSTLVLDGQNVSSQKLIKSGFQFQFPYLTHALSDLCQGFKKSQKEIVAEQWLPKKPQEIYPFFSNEKNLEKLTPEFLNFRVLKKSTDEIHEGTLIDYRLSLHGIPFKWRTRIENWNPGSQFVDTQLSGPYKLWHHTHDFIEFGGGTLMRDRVLYQVPMGWIGDFFAGLKVKADVSKIFSYRRKIIHDLFVEH
jgi:uncharacterized protein (TIGR01777 family)